MNGYTFTNKINNNLHEPTRVLIMNNLVRVIIEKLVNHFK